MARNILQTVVLLICINYIDGQYFDLLQALQPFIQTQAPQSFNFYSDVTTRRPKPKRPSTDNTRNTDSRRVASEEKRRKQINPPIFDTNFFSTTQKIRTTKSPLTGVIQSQSRLDSPKTVSKSKGSSRNDATNNDPGIIYFEDNLTRPSNSINNPKNDREIANRPKSTTIRTVKKPNLITSNGNAWYDSNSVTRPPYETTKTTQRKVNKNVYTTHNPLLNRPGVKPPVVNGPPITNRPVTQRPDFNLGPDLSQADVNESPKVIAGPDEDSMTAVERKRHIDVAERMCDKYKAMNMKQVHAIPLVPSPQPVKVNVSSCAPTTVPLVVGGRVVTIEEFPHMALVGWLKTKNRGYAWKCGGSLLSNQFILTAGHCAYQDRDDSVIAGPPRVVQLGSSYLNDPKAVVKKVAAVIRHPKYKQPKAYYDLSILKMASTVTLSDKIKPACLGVPPQPNQPILATGWGRTEFGGSQSDELRSVSIPIWEMDECHSILGISMKLPYGPSSDSQVCAGERRGGKDTCQGDSGGPAQIQDGCTWRVVAVTSVGRSCGAAETPAIYATVQRAFISAVVFGNKVSQNDNSRRDIQATSNNRGTNEAADNWNSNTNVQGTNNNRGTNQGSNNFSSNTNFQSTNNNRDTNQATNSWNSNRDEQVTNNNRGTNQAANIWNSNTNVQGTNNNRGTNQGANNWNSNTNLQSTNNNRETNQATNSWNSNRDVQNNNRGTNQAANNWNNNRDVQSTNNNNRVGSQATNNNRNVNQQATNNNKDIYQANNQRNDNWSSNNGQNFNRQNNDFNNGFITNPSIADSSVNVNNQEKRNNQNNYNAQNQQTNEYNYNVYTTEASNYNARPETYEFYNPVRETGSDQTDYNYGASNYNYNRETYNNGANYYNNDRTVWWT